MGDRAKAKHIKREITNGETNRWKNQKERNKTPIKRRERERERLKKKIKNDDRERGHMRKGM